MADIRIEVANRLKAEMSRKGLSHRAIVGDGGVSDEVLTGYLSGHREIKFSELRPICDALSLQLMRLLAPKFDMPLHGISSYQN